LVHLASLVEYVLRKLQVISHIKDTYSVQARNTNEKTQQSGTPSQIIDVRSLTSVNFGSDHQLVMAKLRLTTQFKKRSINYLRRQTEHRIHQ